MPGARRVVVEAAQAGARLDAFLARVQAASSAAAARRLIAGGGVRVDGRPMPKGGRLVAGQTVEWSDGDRGRGSQGQTTEESETSAPDAGFVVVPAPVAGVEILLVEPDFVAVNKPPGIPSHPLRVGETGTVANAIAAQFPECRAASPDAREAGLLHRLDVGTSGVLLAARSLTGWHALRAAMKQPGCIKTYIAEVVGIPPPAETVTAPIGRAGRRSGRVRVGRGRGLLPARTDVTLLERRGATSLVEATLGQGRPHQVRAHLAFLGCPVLGDDTYGDEAALRVAGQMGVGGLRLHALRVEFQRGEGGEAIRVEAPLPGWCRPP